MNHEDMLRRARNRPPSTGEPTPDLLALVVLRALFPRLAPLLRRPP